MTGLGRLMSYWWLAAILGNLEAFERLVVRYRPAVVRLARGRSSASTYRRIGSGSLLLAFKALPSIEEPGSLRRGVGDNASSSVAV